MAALFAFGVATGTVSGDGGLLGIYGIFKRPELDLRAPALLLALALGGLFAPAVTPAGSAPPWPSSSPSSPARSSLPPARRRTLNAAPGVAAAIERGAPLGKPALALLRRATDRDHDGYSGLFGGGDCDDHDPRVQPSAADADQAVAPATPSGPRRPSCRNGPPHGQAFRRAETARSPRAAKPARSPSDLNLVLITIDTVRADLHYAGNPHELSPNLDQLAARAVVFDRAYSLASYTGKSVGSLMMGKYGSESHRNWGHSNSFTREDTFLAQRLQRAGFHTMAAHALRYFGAQSGMDRGFDVEDMHAVGEGTIKEMENSVTGDKLTSAALDLLARPESTEKRFFLWMHYLDPHADYLPHPDGPSFGTSQRDLYDGEIAFVDKQVGRVLAAIAAAPWGKKTAIVVTSDHGEAFGEHKMWRHGAELWEELIRVCRCARCCVPGVPPGHVTARRSAVDVVPTLLDLLGVPLPGRAGGEPAAATDFLSGTSFLPDVLFPAGAEPRDVLVDMPDEAAPTTSPHPRPPPRGHQADPSPTAPARDLRPRQGPGARTNLWEKGSPEAREMEGATRSPRPACARSGSPARRSDGTATRPVACAAGRPPPLE